MNYISISCFKQRPGELEPCEDRLKPVSILVASNLGVKHSCGTWMSLYDGFMCTCLAQEIERLKEDPETGKVHMLLSANQVCVLQNGATFCKSH
jgi:hypothetical protein